MRVSIGILVGSDNVVFVVDAECLRESRTRKLEGGQVTVLQKEAIRCRCRRHEEANDVVMVVDAGCLTVHVSRERKIIEAAVILIMHEGPLIDQSCGICGAVASFLLMIVNPEQLGERRIRRVDGLKSIVFVDESMGGAGKVDIESRRLALVLDPNDLG